MPQVIAFVARLSGTGKTTLVEQLIALLKERGHRVGAIKHDAHKFDIDKPGKDSYRFTAAGADCMLITSSEKLALVKQLDQEPQLEALIEDYFSDVDIVIVEGFKNSSVAKIEVHRAAHGELLYASSDCPYVNIIAVASDQAFELDIPLLDLNDATSVADFVEQELL
jgi:molybdopterin-guanine dinucleotide biosynthesis protein B/molybdopterin-guanine dinucleotide biosynthesis protein